MNKSWVIVRMNERSGVGGSIKIWRTYDGDIWGSPLYTVLGYYDGSYRDAQRAYPAASFKSDSLRIRNFSKTRKDLTIPL